MHRGEIQSLFAELWTEDPEEEVALRHGARFVPRLERATREKVLAERVGAWGNQGFSPGDLNVWRP